MLLSGNTESFFVDFFCGWQHCSDHVMNYFWTIFLSVLLYISISVFMFYFILRS